MKPALPVLAVVLVILCAGIAVHAEERKWHNEVEITYVGTGGNTEVTTLAGKNKLSVMFTEKTKGTWTLDALYGKSNGETNAESYGTEVRIDRSHSERLYSFGYGGWARNRFAGFDARYYVGAGGGYRFVTGPRHFLLGEAGVTYNREEYTDDTENDFLGGRLYGKYEYHFREKNRFTQDLEWLPAFNRFDNWKLNAETALLSALNSWLSLKASYQVKYNNDPIGNLKKTDTILGVALVANF